MHHPDNYNPFYNPFSHMSVFIPEWKHTDANAVEEFSTEHVKQQIVENLQQVFDPEIPINIYDIGLIYKVEVSESGEVDLVMTLTTPNCPSAQELPEVAAIAVNVVPHVKKVNFELTFDPPWSPTMMHEDAKLIMLAEYGVTL